MSGNGALRMRFTKKSIVLTVVLALTTWLVYLARPVDRIVVIAGHGYRIPLEYPGGHHGFAASPIESFATAVVWPSMDPWTRKAEKQRAPSQCDILQIFADAANSSIYMNLDKIALKNYYNQWRTVVKEQEKFGMERWVVLDRQSNKPFGDEIYIESVNGRAEFVSKCFDIDKGPNPQCESSFVLLENNMRIYVHHSMFCMEARNDLRMKINELIIKFEKLYLLKH